MANIDKPILTYTQKEIDELQLLIILPDLVYSVIFFLGILIWRFHFKEKIEDKYYNKKGFADTRHWSLEISGFPKNICIDENELHDFLEGLGIKVYQCRFVRNMNGGFLN